MQHSLSATDAGVNPDFGPVALRSLTALAPWVSSLNSIRLDEHNSEMTVARVVDGFPHGLEKFCVMSPRGQQLRRLS